MICIPQTPVVCIESNQDLQNGRIATIPILSGKGFGGKPLMHRKVRVCHEIDDVAETGEAARTTVNRKDNERSIL